MNIALIFAGGVGSRMNNKTCPKQFMEIHDKPILIHTIEHFEKHPLIDAICLVIVADWLEYTKELVGRFNCRRVKWVIPGGATAMESQFNGLETIAKASFDLERDIVLIHDGVRPLIQAQTISDCIECVHNRGNAITVAPAIETIIREDEVTGEIRTYPRNECLLARAPQAFLLDEIYGLHLKAREAGIESSFVDSASMLLHYGKQIHLVDGPPENIKVTNPADYYMCAALLDARECET